MLVSPAGPETDCPRHVTLIDGGLSPRKTARLLCELGIEPYEVDDLVLTHLDTDHCHSGWPAALRTNTWSLTTRIHRRHRGRAQRSGMLHSRTELFEEEFGLGPRITVSPTLMSHDELGVASFRMQIRRETVAEPALLGFATDLGRATDDLIDHLLGVDTLAIESNYCPRMQAESDRPYFLKKRITGGAGHLSNQEALTAIEQIAPRDHVVLLHLSRECNDPQLVGNMHTGAEYAFTISEQHRPTRWIWVRPGHGEAPTPTVRRAASEPSLYHTPKRS
ncbi:MAG: phosphoribosyl 1,2-cyclic phosphodiesterase [Phycisphaerales bacterium]